MAESKVSAEAENAGGKQENVMAFCYDFDHTLSPDDMQAQGFIQKLKENVPEFWATSNKLATEHEMDPNLAYMYLMLKGAENKFYVKRDMLRRFGSKIQLYPGLDTWFERVNELGARQGLTVEHYIISSGIKDMILGTSIGKKFKAVYANTFLYNDDGVATWPSMVINFTNKTQFLFRIEKGAIDVNDKNVNTYYRPEDMRVPFSNMIYIGDSATDIPCMKLVNSFGGHSIGVFDPQHQNREQVYELIRDRRIRYFAPADYSEGSELSTLVTQIISYIGAGNVLRRQSERCQRESREHLGKAQNAQPKYDPLDS